MAPIIIIVELPTAFPYFAAIAAILGAGGAVTGQISALVLYNVCFVLPLIAILAWHICSSTVASSRKRARAMPWT